MSEFGWSYKHVRLELSGAQGWAWYNWAIEQKEVPLCQRAYERVGDGYIRQETKKILARKRKATK